MSREHTTNDHSRGPEPLPRCRCGYALVHGRAVM